MNSNLFDAPIVAKKTPKSYSVSDVSALIKETLESVVGQVRVEGEVSGSKLHTSGHLYFALKDDNAVLDSVCWRMTVSRLPFVVRDGMAVVCTGRITSYAGRSRYQLIVDGMEMAGEGALLKVLEDRKKALAAEGLFLESRKKTIPFLPTVIGLITSPTGAVIQDILHRLADRFPVRVLVWPVAVQGDGAAAQITRAIIGMNAIQAGGPIPRPDVLIVARGGGSLEDLWAFNEESVVRAAAGSQIPLISAVGHETDTTLIDYASDLRAPTPTAAAEKAVPVRETLRLTLTEYQRRLYRGGRRLLEDRTQRLDDQDTRLNRAFHQFITTKHHHLDLLGGRLPHPRAFLTQMSTKNQELGRRLNHAASALWQRRSVYAASIFKQLEAYSYHHVLGRGFAIVRTSPESGKQDHYITDAADLSMNQNVDIVFHDGARRAIVTS